jgi:hypothetical protein
LIRRRPSDAPSRAGGVTRRKERLLADLRVESDVKKRRAIVERIQAVFYEDVGQVKLGDCFTWHVARQTPSTWGGST